MPPLFVRTFFVVSEMTVPYKVFWNDGELPTIYEVVNPWTVHVESNVSSVFVPHQATRKERATMDMSDMRFIDRKKRI